MFFWIKQEIDILNLLLSTKYVYNSDFLRKIENKNKLWLGKYM